jgi:hypothetical protein
MFGVEEFPVVCPVALDNRLLSLLLLLRPRVLICENGGTAGYYKRAGSGSGAKTYIIELEGGGWCVDESDCLARSKTAIGSSVSWPATGCPGMDGGSNGLFSNDCTENVNFCNATMLHLNYADGASFAGHRDEPINVSGTPIYFRGRDILDAALKSFVFDEGMADAEVVILKGCSAGGLATILHLDYVAEVLATLAPDAKVIGLPDAGYFLDHNNTVGAPTYTPIYQYVANMQNVSASVDASCIAAYAPAEQWRCFLAQYTAPFLSTPAFFAQDLDDSWQQTNIFQLPCQPYAGTGNCDAAQMVLVDQYRNDALAALTPVLQDPTHGAFLTDCVQHCHSNIAPCFNSALVANQTLQETFFSWYQKTIFGIPPTIATKVIDTLVGTNPTCTRSCSPY